MLWPRAVRAIDAASLAVARAARWALLVNALLIAGNALSRKLFGVYSPIIYDLQWHFFAAVVVLLMAAYTLQRDEHVRVDVFAHRPGSGAPSTVSTADIYWGAVPFLAIQLRMVMILIAAPGIVLKYNPASDAPVVEQPEFPSLEDYEPPEEKDDSRNELRQLSSDSTARMLDLNHSRRRS